MTERHFIYLPLGFFLLLGFFAGSLPLPAQGPQPPAVVWVEDPLVRVQPSTPPRPGKIIEIAAARNEVESFQVVVSSSGRKLEGVVASVSDLNDGSGNHIFQTQISLYRQEFVYVRNPSPYSTEPPGWWPDPLVPFVNPYDGRPVSSMRLAREEQRSGRISYALSGARFAGSEFTVWPGKNQPLWGDVAIPKNATAGTYSGKLSVQLGEPEAIEVPIRLNVWDFTLPDGPPLSTQFGTLEGIAAKHGVPEGTPQALELEERYATALEEHRLHAPIPRSLYPAVRSNGSVDPKKTHEGLKGYLETHRTGPFRIPTFPSSDLHGKGRKAFARYLQSFFQYLNANGWEKDAYYYPVSEPNSREAYDRVRSLSQLLREAEPRIRFLCTEQPYPQDSAWGDLQGAVNIWCPLFTFWDGDSATRAQQRGEMLWAYTALCQKAPPYHPQFAQVGGQPGLFWQIDFPLLNYRLPLWLSWRLQLRGLLYWSAVHWSDPERDVWTDPGFRNRYNGEGYLLYPGIEAGIPGPVPSLRLKALRDGLEDYAYLALLAKQGKEDFAAKESAKIAASWWKWEEQPSLLHQVRASLAQQIVAAQGKAGQP